MSHFRAPAKYWKYLLFICLFLFFLSGVTVFWYFGYVSQPKILGTTVEKQKGQLQEIQLSVSPTPSPFLQSKKQQFHAKIIDQISQTVSETHSREASTFVPVATPQTDFEPPHSTVTITNLASSGLQNMITNGDFEAGLTNWTSTGDVTLIRGAEHNVVPFDQQMIRIGSDTSDSQFEGNFLAENSVVQLASLPQEKVQSLGFWYNFQSYENDGGFDEPGFLVLMNDTVVHQEWASDLSGSGENTKASGWRFLSIDLTGFPDPSITIAFHAGNTGDRNNQSFVYIDNVTTATSLVNSTAIFTISAEDNSGQSTAHYRYHVQDQEIYDEAQSEIQFNLTAQPDNNEVEYWASDDSGNQESHHYFQVFFDNISPEKITDLGQVDEGNNTFTLSWTAPGDQNPVQISQAAQYDIRYSDHIISENFSDKEWNDLSQPIIIKLDTLPGKGLRAPLLSGHQEIYSVQVETHGSSVWFAIKSKDSAQNFSPLSNIVTNFPSPTVSLFQSGPNSLQFLLQHVQEYEQVDYTLQYLHIVNDQEVSDGLTGQLVLQGEDAFLSPTLFLGTCSTEQSCIPHEMASQFQLRILLKKTNADDVVLETNL